MALLIRGGTVVNADRSVRADVLVEDDKIAAVGENIDAPAGADIVDEIVSARKRPDPRYFIGKGKVDELAESVSRNEALLVCRRGASAVGTGAAWGAAACGTSPSARPSSLADRYPRTFCRSAPTSS